MERFELTDAQAQAIVDMRLRTLTGLEREKLEGEYKELMERIRKLQAILADRNMLLRVIRQEILEIAEKYGDDRRTSIGFDEFDISMEDMIPNEKYGDHHDQPGLYQTNDRGQFPQSERRRQGN